MSKYKYLFKNIGLFTLSSFATKFISFFLLPLYTGILTTEEYGIYDLYSTTISLLYPILSICITEALIRYSLDNDYDTDGTITIGIKYSMLSVLYFLVLFLLNYTFDVIEELNEFPIIFMLWYVCTVINTFYSATARSLDKVRYITISSILCSLITICLNVYFLVVLKWGIRGYFVATLLGMAVGNLFYIITVRVKKLKKFSKAHEQEMKKYGSGLLINAISWWINTSLDRYVVLAMCGIGDNGLISVAYKIPNIIKSFQNVFESAWSLSAIKNYDADDKDYFYINTYNAYMFFITLVTSAIITLAKILAGFLFKGDFFVAWKMVPFYTISVLFSACAGYAGAILAAQKKVKIISFSTLFGAISNLILNIILISQVGVIGASIATMLSNSVVWIVRLICLKRTMKFENKISREILVYAFLGLQVLTLLLCNNDLLMYFIQVVLFGGILISYRLEFKNIVYKLRGIRK